MLKKMVNGEEIILTEDEEKNTLAYWDLNNMYPEYVGACAFDGVNPPYHDMETARRIHASRLVEQKKSAYLDICEKIEIATDAGLDLNDLFKKRQAIRNYEVPDLSACLSVNDLCEIKLG